MKKVLAVVVVLYLAVATWGVWSFIRRLRHSAQRATVPLRRRLEVAAPAWVRAVRAR